MFEMQGDVFGLRATFMEVTEFVRGGSAYFYFLAVLSRNLGHSLLGLLRMHIVERGGSGAKALLLGLTQKCQKSPWEPR